MRLNSTDEGIHNSPHTRRTRSLRPIPEADPDFEIFGAREDIESMFSDLKYRTRGRLCSIYEDRNRFNILSYMILRLSRTLSAYHKRTATTGAAGNPNSRLAPTMRPAAGPRAAPARPAALRAPPAGPERGSQRPRVAL